MAVFPYHAFMCQTPRVSFREQNRKILGACNTHQTPSNEPAVLNLSQTTQLYFCIRMLPDVLLTFYCEELDTYYNMLGANVTAL